MRDLQRWRPQDGLHSWLPLQVKFVLLSEAGPSIKLQNSSPRRLIWFWLFPPESNNKRLLPSRWLFVPVTSRLSVRWNTLRNRREQRVTEATLRTGVPRFKAVELEMNERKTNGRKSVPEGQDVRCVMIRPQVICITQISSSMRTRGLEIFLKNFNVGKRWRQHNWNASAFHEPIETNQRKCGDSVKGF